MADEITIAENLFDALSLAGISGSTPRIGNSFQAAETGVVTSAMMRIKSGFADPGNAYLYIYACDESYVPTGSPIATSDAYDLGNISKDQLDDHTFTFSDAVELTSGGKYALILGHDSIDTLNGAIENASGYTPGTYNKANDGVNFAPNSGFDFRFGVYGSVGGVGGGGGILPVNESQFESWGF
jgi:hypothetical protein